MRTVRKAAACLIASAFLILPLCAQALTVTFGGGAVTSPPFPGYGNTVGKNNVLDHGLAGASVSDPNPDGDTFKGTVGIPLRE